LPGKTTFSVDYASGVAQDLAGLRAFERARILDHIEEQLTQQPAQETRNRKLLPGLKSPWDQELPVWSCGLENTGFFTMWTIPNA
jgi:hypothetical protein